MFTSYPTYSPYRVLGLTQPRQQGEDVFALQNALNAVNETDVKLDGILGPKTSDAIGLAQAKLGIENDGKAGVITQRALAMFITRARLALVNVPLALPKGQLQHESSFLLGNYSAQREDNSYDAGVAQLNTAHTPASMGFDPVYAIERLIDNTRTHYELYHAKAKFVGDDHTEHRRWMLACGSWNAPYFANYLAGVKPWAIPGTEALELFEAYMRDVTIYL